MLEHRANGLLRRGRGDRERPAGLERGVNDAADSRACGESPFRDDSLVDCSLPVVEVSQPIPLPLRARGKSVLDHERPGQQAADALLASPDPELVAVFLLGPAQRKTELGEGLVEGLEVSVPLRVGEDAIAIEHQCGHSVAPRAETMPLAFPFEPKSLRWSAATVLTASLTCSNIEAGSWRPTFASR